MEKMFLFILACSLFALAGCSNGTMTENENVLSEEKKVVASSKLAKELDSRSANSATNSTNKQQTTMENSTNEQEEKHQIDLSYLEKYSAATLQTLQGDITLEFFAEDAPKTVSNFLKLAEEGFYDGVTFHRVIEGFMIQGGDPNSKDDDPTNDGQGGPGYTVPAEIGRKNTKGTLATARLGDAVNPKKDSSGSQFFINVVDNKFLDNQYTVFGKVTAGMDIVEKIENVQTGANDRPIEDVVIKSVELTEK